MDFKQIKNKNHYIYDDKQEFLLNVSGGVVRHNWRHGDEGEWVFTDDEYVCQILRKTYINKKKDISHDSRVNEEYEDKYIAKINELEQENNELRTKLNERVSCKDYESEGREYFHHNPSSNKVSFFMFDDDYIEQYDIDESMEICTIYNDNI